MYEVSTRRCARLTKAVHWIGTKVSNLPTFDELPFVGYPIKIKKVNIGTKQAPKLENVGDYWDDATISKIT
jgi:hypothetical protein